MSTRLHRARRTTPSELQITAFMNLMVALIPFLLITAVFSQLAVLNLNLPDPSAETPDQPPKRALTVVIRSDGMTVLDANGPIRSFPRNGDDLDLKGLAELLDTIKQRAPEEDKITLLLEPATPYDDLVSVMDTVRVRPDGESALFPEISIGDAPPAAAAAPAGGAA